MQRINTSGVIMDRLMMAEALVARAREHISWIGDDHGDPYEKAMETGAVDEKMQIATKEALDHLRAALDYCAHQVWHQTSGKPIGAPIYFPIAREGAKAEAFHAFMNKKMPGVPVSCPNLVLEFAKMQLFSSKNNAWLPELSKLSNIAKHEHLHVASLPQALLHSRRNEAGVDIISFEPGHAPKRGAPWMMLLPRSDGTPEHTIYEARFLVLTAINVELAHFFKEAQLGVTNIIEKCRFLLRDQ